MHKDWFVNFLDKYKVDILECSKSILKPCRACQSNLFTITARDSGIKIKYSSYCFGRLAMTKAMENNPKLKLVDRGAVDIDIHCLYCGISVVAICYWLLSKKDILLTLTTCHYKQPDSIGPQYMYIDYIKNLTQDEIKSFNHKRRKLK